jgi:hypothetical protein
MTEPEITVTLTDSEFTLGELEEFIARARAVYGIATNALVTVTMPNASAISSQGTVQFELSASTAYRGEQ